MEQKLSSYDRDALVKEIKLDKAIQNFLERNNYENFDIQKVDIENNLDIDFIKINHISYDRSKDETDINLIDFQQILSAISSKSGKFVYVVEGTKDGISLYLGTLRDSKGFLKDTFNGIYSGSKIQESRPNFDENNNFSKSMIGIPSLKRDSDKNYKQSLEKILFPLQGKSFRIVLLSESYSLETIQEIISNYQNLSNDIHRFTKQSKNIQQSDALSEGITLTEGTSESKTEGTSESNSLSNSNSTSYTSSGIRKIFEELPFTSKKSISDSTSISKTKTINYSRTNSLNQSESINRNTSKTDTLGITFDEINKSAQYCEELVDKYIERFQKGLNHGMWNASVYIQSNDEITLHELEHTLKSVYSGDETYFETIRFSSQLNQNDEISMKNLPMIYFDKSIIHPIHNSFSGFSSAINTEELSILASLPNNDIEGISVSKTSTFGQTQAVGIDKYNSIEIGSILNKKKITSQRFKLSLEALNSHLFVSGITGSGKSNTIKLILQKLQDDSKLENKIPFLVIEPAKSEYKHLMTQIDNLQVFRPGAKNDIFKFNPFIFEHSRSNHSVTLTKHVDMLKTTFSSAFPMYGPMPYILEDAIYKIYEDKGWNFETEDNPYFTDLDSANYDRKLLLFPNMEDLKNKIDSVVEESGYAGELDSNIKAALKTRIKNLTLGVKGKIFNSRHAFDSKILFEKPTIIELSNITDDEEKSFLMGLLLNKLYQYREEKGSSDKLKHITVIEEAHRLLPNISFNNSSEEANSKAKAVETFTNILAEIRSYGEGIIIADQIASKLHPDVVKNTNIKILQRTMDKEDRDLVGNSINLNENQILDISELKAGEAIVHNRDIHQAFMVKIDKFNTTSIDDIKINKFNESFLDTYENYRYELPFEKKFYLCPNKLVQLQNIDEQLLYNSVLELIQTVFFNEKNIQNVWNKFKSNIVERVDDKKIYFYLFIKAFQKCNFLSNIQYFKNVDSYIEVYDSFLYLINTLNNEKEEEKDIFTAIDGVKKAFSHKNLKKVYPSMKYYDDNIIDYTLLVLENITSNNEVLVYVNEVMEENIELNKRLDSILNKLFGHTSYDLRYSLCAIRNGKYNLDISKILREGF